MAIPVGESVTASGRTGDYPPAAYAWFVVVCLVLAYAMALIDRQILGLLVQPVKADLLISDTQFSFLAGLAFVLCYCLLGLPLGWAADRYNRRNLILWGLLIWSGGTFACGLAQDYSQLFIARMIVGVGEAALQPAAYSLISDYFPPQGRARATSFYTTGAYIGMGSGLIASAFVLAATANAESVTLPLLGALRGWQVVFVAVSLPGLLVAILLLFVREPVRREVAGRSGTREELARFLRRKWGVLMLIAGAFALNGVVAFGINTWTPALFIRKFGWSTAEVGAAFGAVLVVFGGAGIVAGGAWVNRLSLGEQGQAILLTTRNALLVTPVMAIVLGLAPNAAVALAAVSAIVFIAGVASGLAAIALFQVTPGLFRGQVIAAYIMLGSFLGLGVGVTLIAAISDRIFGDSQAIGSAMSIVIGGASLLGAWCVHQAARSRELNTDW